MSSCFSSRPGSPKTWLTRRKSDRRHSGGDAGGNCDREGLSAGLAGDGWAKQLIVGAKGDGGSEGPGLPPPQNKLSTSHHYNLFTFCDLASPSILHSCLEQVSSSLVSWRDPCLFLLIFSLSVLEFRKQLFSSYAPYTRWKKSITGCCGSSCQPEF